MIGFYVKIQIKLLGIFYPHSSCYRSVTIAKLCLFYNVKRYTYIYIHIYTGCAKKKKDILNIYVKSQIVNIFF